MCYCVFYWGFFCSLILAALAGAACPVLTVIMLATESSSSAANQWAIYALGSISGIAMCRHFAKAAWDMEKQRRWRRSIDRELGFI